jgi:PAS domain S-box-containing protein
VESDTPSLRALAARASGLESAVALAIAEAQGIAGAGELVLGAIGDRLGSPAALLWQLDLGGEGLVVAASWSTAESAEEFIAESRARRFRLDEGLPGLVWSAKQLLWFGDLWTDKRYPRAAAAKRAGLRSSVGVPLVARGVFVGVAEFLFPEPTQPDGGLARMLTGLGGQLGQFVQRVHAEEVVAVSEARKAAVLDAAVDAVITADASGTIIEANHAVASMLGYPIADLIGSRIGDLLVPPELRDAHEAGLRRWAKTGEGRIIGKRLAVEAMHRDGHRVPVELTVTEARLPDQTRMATAFLRDVTEQLQIEAERQRLLEAETAARQSAERAWQRLRLVSDVSELLAETFGYPEAFERLAERVVVDMADLCLIDTADEFGRIHRVAARHRDPLKQPLVDRLIAEFAPDPDGEHPAPLVIRSAQVRFSPTMSEEFLRATCLNDEHFALVRRLGFQSYITVPLLARSRVLGALTLISTDGERRYGEDDVAVAAELARRAAVRIDNARLYQERDRVSHVLQQGLLPSALPAIPGVELEARYLPAGEGLDAGGDFYDVFRVRHNRWALVIGDACGKGPEAAARMGLARPALRALAHAYMRPDRLLRGLNDELLEHRPGDESSRFVTVAYVELQLDSKAGLRLTTTLAGHPRPLLMTKDGAARRLGRPGTLLGVVASVQLHSQQQRINEGDTLLLYTDGLADESGSLAVANTEQLIELMRRHRTTPICDLAAELERMTARHNSDHKRRDDVAFLLARVAINTQPNAEIGP